jgi:peptide chain release factor 1
VAIIDQIANNKLIIDSKDLEISWFSGTGPGGQNRNKVMASCRLRHIPSGITATAQTRSRKNSFDLARENLAERLKNLHSASAEAWLRATRQSQIGSGQRGDKIRTIQFQHNTAIDHRTGLRTTAIEYMKGNMDKLWLSHK